MLIAISAGHHPAAPGAKHLDVTDEHREVVPWADELCRILGPYALRVPSVPLTRKTAFINARRPSCAIEIHLNSLDGSRTLPAEKGCMTLYYPGSGEGRKLAAVCHAALASLFPPDLGLREGYYRLDPKFGPDWFLARTVCPAVILEPDFIDNYEEVRGKRTQACLRLALNLFEYLWKS